MQNDTGPTRCDSAAAHANRAPSPPAARARFGEAVTPSSVPERKHARPLVRRTEPGSTPHTPTRPAPVSSGIVTAPPTTRESAPTFWGLALGPGWVLLPLRLFLGGTFVYAGIQKLTDPQFFNPAARGYIGRQIPAFAFGSPLGGLLLHGVASTVATATAGAPRSTGSGGGVPVKPVVILLGLISVGVFGGWIILGRRATVGYFADWYRAFRRADADSSASGESLWTLRLASGALSAPDRGSPPRAAGAPRFPVTLPSS